jgi:hypothetical protein
MRTVAPGRKLSIEFSPGRGGRHTIPLWRLPGVGSGAELQPALRGKLRGLKLRDTKNVES